MKSATRLVILLLASSLIEGCAGAQGTATEPTPPRDVTEETRADAKALAALEKPGRVLFEEGFEGEDAWRKWFEVRGKEDGRAAIERDPERVRTGRGSARFTAPARDGKSSGAGASAWIGPEGHDRIHFRRWIRFADDYDQGNLNHTGGGLAGVAGTGKWDAMGKAGIRPAGNDSFSAGFEPWKDWGRNAVPGAMALYVYWMDMKRDKDGNFWGNLFMPPKERHVVPPRGKWVCLEQMIVVNKAGTAGGELAAWIDGRLYLHMKGFRWRTDERLRIKRFDAGVYVHEARRENTVWYDDVVVSTGYVGTGAALTKR